MDGPREQTFSMFDRDMVSLDLPSKPSASPTRVAARRDEDLDLVLELRDGGPHEPRPPASRAGEVRRADKSLPLIHLGGAKGSADGLAYHSQQTQHRRDGPPITTSTFSAQAIQWDLGLGECAYVVEWLLNLPDGMIWPDPNKTEAQDTFVRTLGADDAAICMRASGRTISGGGALHLRIDETDAYLFETPDDGSTDRMPGQLVIRGRPDQAWRDRLRHCLSFILGRPLVYLGHTEYTEDWRPTRMRSVAGFSAGGAMFRLHPLPPYPLDTRHRNLPDSQRVSAAVQALMSAYDSLGFGDLSWSYWYAACAPFHSCAVHFGGVLEQLQRRCSSRLHDDAAALMSEADWAGLQGAISTWSGSVDLDPEVRRILAGKVSGLNRAPQNLMLKRVMDALDLQIGDLEMDAWRHRNRAAHGALPPDPVVTIRGNKLLRGLIHRIVAAMTGCSGQYVDYYSLDHPFRPLRLAVPDDR